MAKRIFSTYITSAWTGTADGSQLTSGQYMALFGGSSTQKTDILEVMVTGMASSSSSPTALVLGRSSTIHTGTPTALATPNVDAPMDPATAALAAVVTPFIASGTNQPIRSSTDAKVNLGINAYGGLLRYNSSPTQQFSMLGNTANFGECTLSPLNIGTVGAINAHIIYETY